MDNSQYKQHISIEERNKWDKVVDDFGVHLGAGGINNHRLADGTIPGFSTCDFSVTEKNKLAGIEDGALNNPHPATHPYTMITGLSIVGHTGRFPDLLEIPSTCYVAEHGNCDTINGIRITLGPSAPPNPNNFKELWFDTNERLVKAYFNNAWNSFSAVWS